MSTFRRVSFLASLSSAIFLAACSSTPVAPAASAPAPAPAAPAPVAAAPAAAPVPTAVQAKAATPEYLNPESVLFKSRSVYFDFDKYTVKQEGLALLEQHGKFLAANPNVSIKVEGNADERGGAEYNLALGQKRADAVVKVLKTFGVKDNQLEAVSFGKEKPKATGHDAESYAENRRGDLAYPSK